MSNIRERLLGTSNYNNTSNIRSRLGINEKNYSIREKLGVSERQNSNSSMKLFKKSSAFDDGYQFGDITSTILSTAGDLAANVGKGFLNTVEGVTDAGQYLLADAAKGLSKVKALDIWDKNARNWLKEKADALEENAKFDSTGALFGNNEKESDNLFKKGWSEELDKNSVSDTMVDSVAQGIGNVTAMAGTAYIGSEVFGMGKTATSALDSFSSAYGNARSEAYKNGADDKTAIETATISGFAEAISEQFFDALPGMKVEGWGSKLTGKIGESVSKHFGTKAGKATLKVLDSVGEGAEEVISNALSAIGNDIVHYVDNDYNYGMEEQTGNIFKDTKNAIFSNDSLTSFISASLTSAIVNGGNTFITEKQKKSIITAYANDNNMSYEEAKKMFNSIVDINTNSQIDENTNFNDKIDLEEEETKNLLNSIKNGDVDLKNYVNSITSQINEYEALKKQNKLTSEQEIELNELKNRLSAIQNQSTDTSTSIKEEANLPTVQDIVNQEKSSQSGINLPVYNHQSNISNSDKAILPTVNDFSSSNTNMPTSDIKVDMAKISPEILNDIKGFKLGDPSIESYKGSYIKTMLNEVGIKVPTAMNYVSEVRPDMSFTTTKDLTRQQYASIGNALQKLRSVDVTSVNNANQLSTINNAVPITDSLINKTKVNDTLNYSNNTSLSFSEQLDLWVQGKWNNRSQLVLFKHTPQLYLELGLSDRPITVSSSKLERIINSTGKQNGTYHNLGIETVKQLPNAIANPLNILESSTVKDSIVVVTELSDNDGKIIIVSMALDGEGHIEITDINNKNEIKRLKSNVMTSAYGRNNYDIWMEQNKERIIYDIDDGIIKKRINGEWLQLPKGINSFIADTQSGDTSNKTRILPVTEQSAFSVNNIPQSNSNVNSGILPTTNNMQNSKENINKILNPNEISKLTKENANTTPILPKRGSVNKVNDGNSHFAKNIKDKVNMLNVEQKAEILSKEDVRYYDKVTNKESLEKAFKKINDGGSSETLRWVKQDSKNANATDVAEGWILLKQYADNGDYDSMVEVAKKMREIGTTAGQTVQAFNIMERMTPEGMVKYAQSELSEAYDRMVKNKSKEWIDKYREDFDLKPDEVKFIMDTMQEVQNMEDGYDKRVKIAEIQKLMTDKLPPEKGAKIRSWMRISMLFNPKTQVRNVAGNALIMPVNSFGDLFSSYADKLIAKKTGVRTTGTTNIKAMLKGIKKGAYEATNDYKKGINTKDMEGNRFEISDGKSFSEKNLMGRTLNRTESLLNYVMDVGDRVFSEAAFENSLQNQLVLNNTTEITQEMIDIAHQEALSRTWNDNNNYTRFVLGVRKGLNKLNVNGYGLGDVLIPFAKTPANLTKAIVDYSPAGLISTINKGINLKRSLANGQYTATMQHEFVQSLGKATAGTMLYILGIALAKAGITSGDSDDDKDTANFLKNTLGINSYSIKIGGKSFTYDWAQPLAAPLSITANVVNSKSSDSKALLEGIVGSLDSAGSILLEQSFLQSINDVLNDNDGVVSGIINEILELPARAVPTFSKQIADLVDGTQRTSFEYGKPIQSAVNSIKAKIPFVSKTLNPAVDTMGREIQKYGGKNNIFNVFLNPANVSTENISESAEEIYRLYKETGETDVMPRVAPYYINQKGEKIMMTGKDRVEYQKISGEIIEDNIKKLINNASYSNMSDSDKANVVKDIVNYSYNIAKKDVLGLELSNTYQKAYEYSEIGDIGDYYTFKESIDNTDKDTKKASITKFLIDSDLNNEQLAYLYGNYYSSDKVLNALVQSNIPIKEYIKFNSKTFESDYYANGKTVPNSRKNKVIKYINSLNLSISQKAMLIKMEYSSFKQYDNQIVKYVNNIDCSSYDKKVILKTIGFTSYDKDIINTINSKNISVEEKTKELEELGFKVRNGRVYTK